MLNTIPHIALEKNSTRDLELMRAIAYDKESLERDVQSGMERAMKAVLKTPCTGVRSIVLHNRLWKNIGPGSFPTGKDLAFSSRRD